MVTQRRLTSLLFGRAVFAAVACASLAAPGPGSASASRATERGPRRPSGGGFVVGRSHRRRRQGRGRSAGREIQPGRQALHAQRRRASGQRGTTVGAAVGRRRSIICRATSNIDSAAVDAGVDPIDEGIGADQVWAGAGDLPPLSGRGVTVAVIDSGIDPKHNALKSRVLYTVDFTGGDGVDRFGHGTHVAAIIAGQRGVARRHADVSRRGVGRVSRQPARARRRRRGHGERRHRGDRLGDRPPRATTTSASSTCRSARRCCSRIATTRCARRSSGRCARAFSS